MGSVLADIVAKGIGAVSVIFALGVAVGVLLMLGVSLRWKIGRRRRR